MTGRAPDFIGLGAQRSGTSWIYACLFEHPAVCVPVKEIHFFSRERNWSRGTAWYEAHFAECPPASVCGEFSTSYLTEPGVAERIHALYPAAKLIVTLRDPVRRAWSSYLNDQMAGVVPPGTPFARALAAHPEYVRMGAYATCLEPFLRLFGRDRVLVLVYEDAVRDPAAYIAGIYRFLGVDASFAPSMLRARVNPGRVPRSVALERAMNQGFHWMHRLGLQRLWWLAKKAGLGRLLRRANSVSGADEARGPGEEDRRKMFEALRAEIDGVEQLLGRTLTEWRT